ncbi:hypothetical protein SYNGFB01_07090 [Synechococcus sp. GFB01]|nr:hypothetical protein SYNGFB01_07090 [Synechococcus sp. GFB01]
MLRERRQELGLATPGDVVLEQREVLRRGGIWGLGVLAGAAALGLLATLGQRLVNVSLVKAMEVDAQMASLQNVLQAREANLQQQRAGNITLAKALAAIPSAAALMRDLQERVPEGVQLTEVKRTGSTVTLTGLVSDPASFVRLNVLQLQLAQSPLLSEPRLLKATRATGSDAKATADVQPVAAARPASSQVAFEIQAQARDLAADPALEGTLGRLGAQGLMKRLQLLRKEGLLP